jgi:hypothetical protein
VKLNELPHWPPQWQPLLLRSEKYLNGEIGLLKSVKALLLNDDCLNLTIEHEGIQYAGVLQTDSVFRNKILLILAGREGCPIKEIGELEFEA